MLHTDNEKEFVNELLTNWLEKRNIKHILRGKYHPQSQRAVESFNKTIQKFLNEAYTNSMFNEDEEWSLSLIVSDFLHYYNSKRVHSNYKGDSKINFIQLQKQKHCITSHCKYRELLKVVSSGNWLWGWRFSFIDLMDYRITK